MTLHHCGSSPSAHETAVAHLYDPSLAYRLTPTQGRNGAGESFAPSAPDGAVVYYSAGRRGRSRRAGTHHSRFSSDGGDVIRTLKTDKEKGVEGGGENASYMIPAEKGINRITWDLRSSPTTSIDYKFIFGAARDDDAIQGYTVAAATLRRSPDLRRCRAGEHRRSPVGPDQRLTMNKQFAISKHLSSVSIFVMIDSIYKRVSSLQNIQKQVELRKSLADDAGDDEMVEAAEALLAALKQWQEAVTTPHRGNNQDVLNFAPQLDAFLTGLYQQADSAVLGITQGQRDRLADLQPQYEEAMRSWDRLVETNIAEFTRRAGPAVIVPTWE